MTKLEKLYSTIQNLEELGIELPDDVLKQTSELEESLIKKEILPIVKEKIEPTLRQIQRDITLVVDYVPGASVRVRISREPGIYNKEDFVELTPDPEVEHGTRIFTKTSKREPKSSLRVIKNDGTLIEGKNAAQILVNAIKIAGPLKVRELNITCCKVPLVSTTKDRKYSIRQIEVMPGLYVITHSSNVMKKDFLEKISNTLHLGWKIEVIK